jgi:hypothetical protein
VSVEPPFGDIEPFDDELLLLFDEELSEEDPRRGESVDIRTVRVFGEDGTFSGDEFRGDLLRKRLTRKQTPLDTSSGGGVVGECGDVSGELGATQFGEVLARELDDSLEKRRDSSRRIPLGTLDISPLSI